MENHRILSWNDHKAQATHQFLTNKTSLAQRHRVAHQLPIHDHNSSSSARLISRNDTANRDNIGKRFLHLAGARLANRDHVNILFHCHVARPRLANHFNRCQCCLSNDSQGSQQTSHHRKININK